MYETMFYTALLFVAAVTVNPVTTAVFHYLF